MILHYFALFHFHVKYDWFRDIFAYPSTATVFQKNAVPTQKSRRHLATYEPSPKLCM